MDSRTGIGGRYRKQTKQVKPKTFRKMFNTIKARILKGHGTKKEMLIFLGNDKFIRFGIIGY